MKKTVLAALASVFVSATTVCAVEQPILKILAIGQASSTSTVDDISPFADCHKFTCAFGADGGMLTTLVDTAMRAVTAETSFSFGQENGPNAQQAAMKRNDVQISFPWYRPDCDGGAFLSGRTRDLCRDYFWSEPIYSVFWGYFGEENFEAPLRGHRDVFGKTLCLPGQDFSQMLREVGISTLNTKFLLLDSPQACLKAIVRKQADLTLLPIAIASLEIKNLGLEDAIVAHPELDRQIMLHAIAPKSSHSAIADIGLLNYGLESIRNNGRWFQIIASFADRDNQTQDLGYQPNLANRQIHPSKQ